MDKLLCRNTGATASKTAAPSDGQADPSSGCHTEGFTWTGVFVSSSGVQCPPVCFGRVHYKERLVELINRCGCDPAVLFSAAEMKAELQRWNIGVPTRQPDEPEALYAHRLRIVSDTTRVEVPSFSDI